MSDDDFLWGELAVPRLAHAHHRATHTHHMQLLRTVTEDRLSPRLEENVLDAKHREGHEEAELEVRCCLPP